MIAEPNPASPRASVELMEQMRHAGAPVDFLRVPVPEYIRADFDGCFSAFGCFGLIAGIVLLFSIAVSDLQFREAWREAVVVAGVTLVFYLLVWVRDRMEDSWRRKLPGREAETALGRLMATSRSAPGIIRGVIGAVERDGWPAIVNRLSFEGDCEVHESICQPFVIETDARLILVRGVEMDVYLPTKWEGPDKVGYAYPGDEIVIAEVDTVPAECPSWCTKEGDGGYRHHAVNRVSPRPGGRLLVMVMGNGERGRR